MGQCFKGWLLAAAVILFPSPSIWASGLLINDFKNGLSPRWVEKSFKGNTQYEWAVEGGQHCIKATSRSSASALYYEIEYDPKAYPVLKWRWKVDHVLLKGNGHRKDTDDYAARVYVVFPSILFWRTKAINYIWASRLPRGGAMPNAYTSNAMMIAVESGSARTGKWIQETRNVWEDYRRYFKEDPPKVGAIAIMTDTDDTGEEATAWYGPIQILPAR